MIKLTDFAGLVPKMASRNLPAQFARVAENVDLEKGTLKPWRKPLKIAPLTGQSLLVDDCCVSTGRCETRFAKTGLLCDEIVVATDLKPYPVYAKNDACPLQWQRLAFACELPAPVASAATLNQDFRMEKRSYIYTLVNDMGWESQPSYPSNAIRCNTVGSVTVSGLPSSGGARVRIYRSAVSLDFGAEQPEETEASYLLVGEVAIGASSFTDNVKIAGAACVTDEYDAPPDNLREIQSWREGRLAGLADNVFLMSERNLPYAWNRKFAVTFYDTAIALICTNRLAYVLSDGKPVLLELRGDCEQGQSPIAVQELAETLPIVARQSAAEYMGGVVYASHNGLVLLNGTQASIVTQQHYTPEQWRKLLPHTMRGVVYQGYYYGATDTTTIRFRLPDNVYPQAEQSALTTLSIRPQAWHKSDDDRLFFSLDDGVYLWGEGEGEMPFTWRGNLNTLPGITHFSAYKVIANASGNRIKHSVDDRQIQDYTHKHNQPTRLPVGRHGLDWQVEISGTAEVFEYHIATSIRELAQK